MKVVLNLNDMEKICVKELLSDKKLSSIDFYKKHGFTAMNVYGDLIKKNICKLEKSNNGSMFK